MKKLIIGLAIMAALASLPLSSYAEDLKFDFDGREWAEGYKAGDDEQGIREYVLKGETVNDWTELVTVQAFFGLQEKTTPGDYMANMRKGLKEVCPDPMWNVIRAGKDDITFEWEVKKCPDQDNQYEIDRIISGAKAIWYIHYVTKKVPIPPEKRSKWIKLIESATLVER